MIPGTHINETLSSIVPIPHPDKRCVAVGSIPQIYFRELQSECVGGRSCEGFVERWVGHDPVSTGGLATHMNRHVTVRLMQCLRITVEPIAVHPLTAVLASVGRIALARALEIPRDHHARPCNIALGVLTVIRARAVLDLVLHSKSDAGTGDSSIFLIHYAKLEGESVLTTET